MSPGFADLRNRTVLSLLAVAAAVILPQLLRLVGLSSDELALAVQSGPTILVGLVAGPRVGALTGLLTTLVGFGLTGVPDDSLVLMVMVELAGYGLVAGLLGRRQVRPLAVVVIAQLGGRIARLVAVAIAADGMTELLASFGQGLASLRDGLLAIMAQWLLIPPIAEWLRVRAANRAATNRF